MNHLFRTVLLSIGLLFVPVSGIRAQDDTVLDTAFVAGAPHSLDPLEASSPDELTVVSLLCDGLLRLSSEMGDLSLIPALANEWSVSDDGLSYTFYLVQEASFADGSPFTAESVAFTFDRMMAADSPSSSAVLLRDLIGSVEIVDDYTVIVSLNDYEETAAFLIGLSLPGAAMLAPHQEDIAKNPLCVGPFTLEVETRAVVLQSNPSYYGEVPPVDMIVFNEMSPNDQIAAFAAGDLDLVDLSTSFDQDTSAVMALLLAQGIDPEQQEIFQSPMTSYLEEQPFGNLSRSAEIQLGTVYNDQYHLLVRPEWQAMSWWCRWVPWCYPVDPLVP